MIIEGRFFPVELYYSLTSFPDFIVDLYYLFNFCNWKFSTGYKFLFLTKYYQDAALNCILQLHFEKEDDGDILTFLTG